MESLYTHVKTVLENARTDAYRAVNSVMVKAYWQIGRLIVEDEQEGEHRAEYGKKLLKYLSERLTEEFGKGFDTSNLRYMRLFYRAFPICDTLRHELSWSHYRLLTRVDNLKARDWYMHEAAQQNWSSRALERQINAFYYERLLATREANQHVLMQEAEQVTRRLQLRPGDNPTIGLILCSEKEDTVIKYSVLKDSEQLFASKYVLYLPTEEQLKAEIDRDRYLIEQAHRNK